MLCLLVFFPFHLISLFLNLILDSIWSRSSRDKVHCHIFTIITSKIITWKLLYNTLVVYSLYLTQIDPLYCQFLTSSSSTCLWGKYLSGLHYCPNLFPHITVRTCQDREIFSALSKWSISIFFGFFEFPSGLTRNWFTFHFTLHFRPLLLYLYIHYLRVPSVQIMGN